MTATGAQSLNFLSSERVDGVSSQAGADGGRGEVLGSLAEAGALRERFYAWRGRSGRRYVCSVFGRDEEQFVAEVISGVIVGVTRDAGGSARPLFITPAGACGLSVMRERACEAGVSEWHVHFCESQDVFGDLAASLLH